MAIKSIVRESYDVFVCIEGKLNHIDIRDIIYVEHNCRTVFMYTMKGIVYIPYMPLKRIYDALGNDYLHQCHKSFLVNCAYIERVDRTANLIMLKNDIGKIAIGRKYREEFLQNMHLK